MLVDPYVELTNRTFVQNQPEVLDYDIDDGDEDENIDPEQNFS